MIVSRVASSWAALALDPSLGEAHSALAVALQYQWDWPGAEAMAECSKVLEMEPGNAEAGPDRCIVDRSTFIGPMIMLRKLAFLLLVVTLEGLTMNTAAAGEIFASLESFAYGYAVEIHVNGTRIEGIKGGKSEGTRLMNHDNPMKAEAPADLKHIFALKEGENRIAVKFARQSGADAASHVNVQLILQEPYAAEILNLDSKAKASGQVERAFRIDKTAPRDAATIRITDADL